MLSEVHTEEHGLPVPTVGWLVFSVDGNRHDAEFSVGSAVAKQSLGS